MQTKRRAARQRVEETLTARGLPSDEELVIALINAVSGPPPETDLAKMIEALGEVTGMIADLNGSRLARLATSLLDMGATPALVRQHFGRGGTWYEEDYRGKRGEWPSEAAVRENIFRFARPRTSTATSKNADGSLYV